MNYQAENVDAYIALLPQDRKAEFSRLRQLLLDNIPRGFVECMSYGMPSYAVPHSIYPDGYHCKPEEPLPFISLGNQKNYIGFYHSGLSVFPEIEEWFRREYQALEIGKLDMGKACIRLKKMESIPFALLGELCQKISVDEWIEAYEKVVKG
ncbi:MAG: DUF1801 domain-containing protein [Spirochaetaceae bacterium]|nr:MAG: DUF1801 domain-containing protein [Spirochaetaceae bacterium]